MTVLLNVYLEHSLHLGCFLCIRSSNTLIPKGFKQGFKHPLPAELPLPVQHSVHTEKRKVNLVLVRSCGTEKRKYGFEIPVSGNIAPNAHSEHFNQCSFQYKCQMGQTLHLLS